MNKKTGWKHGTDKAKNSGKIKDGARISALEVDKRKTSRQPKFDRQAFLNAALPIFGIDDKKSIEVAIKLAEHGLPFAQYGPGPQVVLLAVYSSTTSAELRAKLHQSIKELTAVMELTM